MKEKIRKAYDILVREYYENRKNATGLSHFYNENLEMPTMLKMLGNVKGRKVLDLGCGPGIYAKILSDRGAKVKGIDNSDELVKIAKEEAPKAEIVVGDAEKLPYKNGEFDIVMSALVLGHFKSWDKISKEVKRVLKKRGLFIFSGYNPVADSFVDKKWFLKEFRIVANYFKEDWKKGMWIESNEKVGIVHHHKTYGTIVRLLVKHGFEIVDYEDCRPTEESKKMYPERHKKYMNMPYFCVWKVKKT